jgi:hypothetical protein
MGDEQPTIRGSSARVHGNVDQTWHREGRSADWRYPITSLSTKSRADDIALAYEDEGAASTPCGSSRGRTKLAASIVRSI